MAVGYAKQFIPHTLLKRCARINQRNRELLEIAGEIFLKLFPELIQVRVLAGDDRAREELLQCAELRFQHSPVCKLQKAYSAIVCGGDERSERTLLPRDNDTIQTVAGTGWPSEGAAKRISESTVRFIAVSQRDVVETCSSPKLIQSAAHPPRPAIGLKCHTVVLAKIPPNPKRIDAGPSQFRVLDPFLVAIDERQGAVHPLRRPAVGIQRTTARA